MIAAVVIYVVVFAGLAFDLHNGMRTHKADLGQMDQDLEHEPRPVCGIGAERLRVHPPH
ncbi:MAG: hypothetical protein R2856_27205 [Caldilineaceae bacterium]